MHPTYLVECFWPGVTCDAFAEALTRAHRHPGGGVTYVDSILVPSDEIVLSLVDGPSVDAVRRNVQRSGLRCDRVIESVRLGVPSPAVPDRLLERRPA